MRFVLFGTVNPVSELALERGGILEFVVDPEHSGDDLAKRWHVEPSY